MAELVQIRAALSFVNVRCARRELCHGSRRACKVHKSSHAAMAYSYGWECQFLFNGEFAYGRRWTMRAEALAEVEEKRQELEAEGWQQLATE